MTWMLRVLGNPAYMEAERKELFIGINSHNSNNKNNYETQNNNSNNSNNKNNDEKT